MLKLRIKVSYVQQDHYHLIRDERDASIEQPSASKVKWTSPGQFMMSRLRILRTPATLTWRAQGPPQSLQSNQESVLLCIVGIITIFTNTLELKTCCWGSKVDQLFILKVFIPFALALIVLPLSWQRVNTWSWATWTQGQEEYFIGVLGDSYEILPSLFSGDSVKRFFLLWSGGQC